MTPQQETLRTVQLPQGPIQYRDIGEGPTLLFVHGFLVNGEMWRKVYGPLSDHFRCVVLTLPLGGHALPVREDADLSPSGVAQLMDDFMAALELKEVTVVACDTGGALTQLLAVHHPGRIARLVLTNCDAFEHFVPPVLKPFITLFQIPGGASFFGYTLRFRFAQKLLYALLAHARLEPSVAAGYFGGFIRQPEIRRDAKKVALGVSSRYTLDAAEHFSEFHKPVLVVWGQDDRLFVFGERLADAFPNARLERVANSKTFVSEDQPEVLAESIRLFMNETEPRPVPA